MEIMMHIEKIVKWVLDKTHSWNNVMHREIEVRVLKEYEVQFPKGSDDPNKIIENMRSFYYSRMMTTIGLLIAGISCVVSAVALIVSLVALLK
ncbi:hypothetical protein MC70_009150 [Serratia marcescens]|uniref:Uncharacterized protein n=2 Tax=Serratia marcescens TaxID=615 RepID=A0AAP8PIC2_SERMA|nr:hypothetical protein MC70_009150 [Serratia marcescens]